MPARKASRRRPTKLGAALWYSIIVKLLMMPIIRTILFSLEDGPCRPIVAVWIQA